MVEIAYLCNGKSPSCIKIEEGKEVFPQQCAFNRELNKDDNLWRCNHTTNPDCALHGVCEGNPDWFPERFIKSLDITKADGERVIRYWEKECY